MQNNRRPEALLTRRRPAYAHRMALALFVLAACGERAAVDKQPLRTTGQATTASPSNVTVKKSPTSDTLEISGEWSEAGDGTIWTAFAIQGRISRIEENWLPSGEPNSRRTMIYDSAGHIVRYSEERQQMVSNPSASPSMLHMSMSIDFAAAGGARTNKVVDGVERPVQSWDIDNARRHADELLALARQGIPAK